MLLELGEIIARDLLPCFFGDPQDSGRTIEPVERHLVECPAFVYKVVHRIEVRALMRTHGDVAYVVLERLGRAMRHDRQLGIHREGLLTVDEWVGEIYESH